MIIFVFYCILEFSDIIKYLEHDISDEDKVPLDFKFQIQSQPEQVWKAIRFGFS